MEANLKMLPEENRLLIDFRSHCSFDTYWIRSWNVSEKERVYCEWNVKDPV